MLSQRMDTLSKSFSKSGHRVTKPGSFTKENRVAKRRHEALIRRPATASSPATEDTITNRYASIAPAPSPSLRIPSSLDSLGRSIITLVVGADQRLFAAHEDVLCKSPFFHSVLRTTYAASRIALPDEEPEILSSVLEFLYTGDYHPRLVHDQLRNSWELEWAGEGDRGCPESIIYHRAVDGDLLKDTVVYCAAEKYGLAELKKLALRKQGLRSGIQCSTILASARYAYANTPDSDSKLRAHYLALIIRSRSTFKRSGTMQLEMYNGGTQLFFDLFVALCNHVDDISSTH